MIEGVRVCECDSFNMREMYEMTVALLLPLSLSPSCPSFEFWVWVWGWVWCWGWLVERERETDGQAAPPLGLPRLPLLSVFFLSLS